MSERNFNEWIATECTTPVAGLFTGIAESIVSSKGIKNFSLYSKRVSGAVLAVAGRYIGRTNV